MKTGPSPASCSMKSSGTGGCSRTSGLRPTASQPAALTRCCEASGAGRAASGCSRTSGLRPTASQPRPTSHLTNWRMKTGPSPASCSMKSSGTGGCSRTSGLRPTASQPAALTRCCEASGAGRAASGCSRTSGLRPTASQPRPASRSTNWRTKTGRSPGITNDLPSAFCWVSQVASSFISCSMKNSAA